ncbi:MAG: hypothetical protein C0625_08735 [Arcobacter sp.]|nr:MAG: hypothetical protein C0625_08735 [Arcobacter sp.]
MKTYILLITFFLINAFGNVNTQNTLNNQENDILNLTADEIKYLSLNKKIVIGNEYDWIPFDFNEDGVPKGYVVDYIKLICKKLKLEPIFITDKWDILVNKIKNKKIDILPVLAKNKKREEYLNFSKPYITQNLSIITKKSTNTIINLDDMIGKKIGIMKSWNITNILRKHYPNINIIEFESLKDIFDAIKNNFIDASIQNELISNYYINKDYQGYIKSGVKVDFSEHNTVLHIGIRKDLPQLQVIFDKAINSLTKDEIDPIYKKWINYGKEINFNTAEKEFIKNNIIKVSTTSIWAPFNFKDENGELQGIAYDFWNKVVEKANLKVQYTIEENFYDILNKIKSKDADLTMATSKTKDREDYALFSNTILKSQIGIATLQEENYIPNANKLLGKKIAVGKNFTAHKLLEERFPTMQFHFVKNVKEGLEEVSEGKAYAYVDIMPVLSYSIKYLGFSNIKISGQTGIDYELRIMMRNDYSLLQSIVNKSLNKITVKEKQSIYNKWIETPFKEKTDYSLLWKIIIVFLLILSYVIYKNRQLLSYQKNLEKTQDELKKSLVNFKSLINFNIAGILIIRENRVRYLNDEILNMLDYDEYNNLINIYVNKLLLSDIVNDLESLIDKSNNSYEAQAIKKDGTKIPVLLKVNKISFDNQESTIISIIDLSDVKNKEDLILQQSKIASLGEMIGNIAHQWRQPLSSISTAASGMKLLKEYGKLDDEHFNNGLDSITETSQFLSQTIDDFRNYIKDNKQKKEFNLNASIKKVVSIMQGSFTNHFIKVKINVEDLTINGYENELNQILLNILSNSRDALKNIKEEDRYIIIDSLKKDKNVILTIIDTGGGIEENILKKVFEPYFTTKHQSQGTGLGLYMTHKIITESMRGNIFIENCTYKKSKHCTKVILSIPIN